MEGVLPSCEKCGMSPASLEEMIFSFTVFQHDGKLRRCTSCNDCNPQVSVTCRSCDAAARTAEEAEVKFGRAFAIPAGENGVRPPSSFAGRKSPALPEALPMRMECLACARRKLEAEEAERKRLEDERDRQAGKGAILPYEKVDYGAIFTDAVVDEVFRRHTHVSLGSSVDEHASVSQRRHQGAPLQGSFHPLLDGDDEHAMHHLLSLPQQCSQKDPWEDEVIVFSRIAEDLLALAHYQTPERRNVFLTKEFLEKDGKFLLTLHVMSADGHWDSYRAQESVLATERFNVVIMLAIEAAIDRHCGHLPLEESSESQRRRKRRDVLRTKLRSDVPRGTWMVPTLLKWGRRHEEREEVEKRLRKESDEHAWGEEGEPALPKRGLKGRQEEEGVKRPKEGKGARRRSEGDLERKDEKDEGDESKSLKRPRTSLNLGTPIQSRSRKPSRKAKEDGDDDDDDDGLFNLSGSARVKSASRKQSRRRSESDGLRKASSTKKTKLNARDPGACAAALLEFIRGPDAKSFKQEAQEDPKLLSETLRPKSFREAGLFFYMPFGGVGVGLAKECWSSEKSGRAWDKSKPLVLTLFKKKFGLQVIQERMTEGELYQQIQRRIEEDQLEPFFG